MITVGIFRAKSFLNAYYDHEEKQYVRQDLRGVAFKALIYRYNSPNLNQ
ncbi:hypothetical protein THF1C08_140102 [Vibrio jasicida]|uniref:KTSC domain-containing protein n=1 Tax=Vibrio jasicida TaxID=766224 RepID=A0AAU9QGI6_9VIBR|nr:hypothetical protein THF1C08_140102 [Vibrio jasicida]CAH1575486.1 hypothetical protein THF1A12_130102 [Vibrio jasicida]